MNFTDLINPYAYAMQLRRLLYRKRILKSESVDVPVISIGNLSMGGTGKTPITRVIAEYCIENLHKKTAIVLRGYKRKSSGFLLISNGKEILENVSRSGDEAQLYAQYLPEAIVVCDEDRTRGAQHAVSLGAEIILLDDGFQHTRLRRDLNIALISSHENIPPVLPFGKGRESGTALNDADIIIYSEYSGNRPTIVNAGNKPVVLARSVLSSVNLYSGYEELDALPDILNGERILALSGIAHPERFEIALSGVASEVIPYRLSDHSEYDTTVLSKMVLKAIEEKCEFIATTTKDAVKMQDSYMLMQQQDHSLPPLAVIHSNIEFLLGREILFNKINDLFNTLS